MTKKRSNEINESDIFRNLSWNVSPTARVLYSSKMSIVNQSYITIYGVQIRIIALGVSVGCYGERYENFLKLILYFPPVEITFIF